METSVKAKYFEVVPDGVKCLLCPVACRLHEGQIGRCKVRQNRGGILYSLVYGQPCAVHVDPIEKKPLFHFLPGSSSFSIGTAGCNLTCLNCQNWQISHQSPHDVNATTLMPDEVVKQALLHHCQSISYTYNDPTVYFEYAYDTAVIAYQHGLRNVMVSAGYINNAPLLDFCQVMDAANIDLKGFDAGIYHKLNGAHLENVLQTLVTLKENGVWLEITNLVIPEWSDKLDDIARMCKWLFDNDMSDVPLHFSRFYPQHHLSYLAPTPVSTLEKACDIARHAGLNFVYVGNVPSHQAESTFCQGCGKLVIERTGFSVLSNHIKQGACEFCLHTVPGVWC